MPSSICLIPSHSRQAVALHLKQCSLQAANYKLWALILNSVNKIRQNSSVTFIVLFCSYPLQRCWWSKQGQGWQASGLMLGCHSIYISICSKRWGKCLVLFISVTVQVRSLMWRPGKPHIPGNPWGLAGMISVLAKPLGLCTSTKSMFYATHPVNGHPPHPLQWLILVFSLQTVKNHSH